MKLSRSVVAISLVCAASLAPATSRAAGVYYVDNTNPNASDNGPNPGTASTPYRTISAAVAARTGPGTTIYVLPGTYPEQVSVPAPGGSSGSPLVLQALGTGVVVEGSDDFSATSLWTSYSGNVWRARNVSWSPFQVFADGVRLTPSLASPASIPAGTFVYVAGEGLYVNAGGDNPGTHMARVGRRLNGFKVSGKSWVTISGFTVTRFEDRAIYLSSASSNCVISNNTVTFAYRYGIAVSGCTAVLVASNVVTDSQDHGIALGSGTSGCTVQDNEACRSADPADRRANGINLNRATNNTLLRNKLHDNQDTGLQVNSFSNDNVLIQNVSWSNGDHGFDHLNYSTGTVHRNDVAYGNYKDGFSIEGGCTGTSLFNCIGTDNGLTVFPREFDLWVDAASSVGFVSDYNLFWNSNGQPPVKYGTVVYSTVAAYSASSGNDSHSVEADPRFVNPGTGDYHLRAGSAAIDNANTSVPYWPATDADGRSQLDDLATPNTGTGPVLYADRGAYEFLPADAPPVVTAPASISGPEASMISVSVTASDPEGDALTSLTADLSALPPGNNASFTSGPGNTSGTLTWTPTYSDARTTPYHVVFTASNFLPGTAATDITVTNVDRAPSATAPAAVTMAEGAQATILVTASDPDTEALTSLTADLTALPAGHNAVFTVGTGNTSGTFRWTPTFSDSRLATYNVTFTASNALSSSATTAITVTNTDRRPVVIAPPTAIATAGHRLTVVVSASDPDGQSLTSLTADLSKLPKKNLNASFTAGAGNTSGTFMWTPQGSNIRLTPYNVTFTASNALPGTAVTAITVRSSDSPPTVTSPATASVAEGSPLSFTVTSADVDGDAIASLSANLSTLPAGNNAVFTAGAGNTSGTLTWSPTFADGRATPYNVIFTAANSLTGADTTAIVVTPVDRSPVVTAPATALVIAGSALSVTVAASDPDGDAITSLAANLSALPAGNNAAFTAGAGNISGTLTWTPAAADVRATPYSVVFTATNARSGQAITAITVKGVDVAPTVTAPATAAAAEGSLVTFTVSGSDPDGDPIATLTAGLSVLPAGHDATFTVGAGNTSGTFRWTPGFSDSRTDPYAVTFTASNALSGSASTEITVADVDRAPLVTAPSSASAREHFMLTIAITAADPDGDALSALTADLSALPSGNDAVFTAGEGNTAGTLTWTPVTGDARPSPYVVAVTAANALSGSATTAITVLPPNVPPTAALSVTPATGNAPLALTANASGSGDTDGTVVSYRFDFGDGTVVGPQPEATATHTYAAGRWTATVLVTDDGGGTATATAPVIAAAVEPGQNWVGNPSFEANTSGWVASGGDVIQRAAGGFDGAFALEMQGAATGTVRFGLNDSPNWVASTAAAGTRYRLTAWVRSASARGKASLRVREYLGSVQQGTLMESPLVVLSPAWQMVTFDYVTLAAGSTLDVQIIDAPVAPGEVFQTDNVSIRVVTGGSAAATAPQRETSAAPSFAAVMTPNPLRVEATLSFSTTQESSALVQVFDASGRRVRTLMRTSNLPAGRHTARFDGKDATDRRVASGIYFYRVDTREGTLRGRFIVLR
jgi:parallel beta-helix repeat protein